MQLYRCIQVHNPPLPITLYIMGVNNEYNSYIVFNGKTKRCTTFINWGPKSHSHSFVIFVVYL